MLWVLYNTNTPNYWQYLKGYEAVKAVHKLSENVIEVLVDTFSQVPETIRMDGILIEKVHG